jgi:hypothetical protein
MHRLLLILPLALAPLGACKGKSKAKDNHQTVQKLTDCEENLAEKQSYIATLEARLAELEGMGDSVVVNLEGEVMKVRGKGPSERTGTPTGSADDVKLYEAFVAALKGSRGSIQKCYQTALKNNATLQGRPVTLSIEVAYRTSGQVSDASFSPRIDGNFDRCMEAVARRWALPAMPRQVAFNYKQTLQPE